MSEQAWETNTTLEKIAAWLGEKRSVVLLTHAKPDGDAMGSTLGLARAINLARGTSGAAATAECWYCGPMPSWWHVLARSTKVREVEPGVAPAFNLDPEAVVVCDTGSWGQLDSYAEWVRARTERACVIDHHAHGDADVAGMRFIDTSAAAVCQTMAELCRLVLGLGSVGGLPLEVAEPLYFGIATDTGWFRHGNVSPDVFRTAAGLLEAGVDHERLYNESEMNDRPARLRLLGRALASLEYHNNETIALMSLTVKDFDETGSAPGDSGGFVDVARGVKKVRVSAILTEVEAHSEDGPVTKISLRSKGGDDAVDVNLVAQKLGGGGHARAAGARVKGSLDEVKAKLLGALA